MRKDFYRQEKGLLRPPPKFSKWRIAWSLDNVLAGFKEFYNENGRYPIAYDMYTCPYLPTPKTLERNFGGIKKIRELLGLTDTDYSRGESRSRIATEIGKRGSALENKTYCMLVDRFHEPFVHWQGKIPLADYRLNVDFIVYHREDKFAIDVFYPRNTGRDLANNVSIKYRTYRDFPYKIYLCVGNEQVNEKSIILNMAQAKNNRNPNAVLVTISQLYQELGDYTPLENPYLK